MNAFPWNIFFVLLAAGLFGTIAIMPYALSINPKVAENLKKVESGTAVSPSGKPAPRLSKPVMLLIGILQTTLLIAIASFIGLLAARKVGLGLPVLQAALEGKPVGAMLAESLPTSILLGLAAGVILLALEMIYFMPRISPELSGMDARIPFWKRALACFYGGIVEEILLRLFGMTVLVWLFGLVWKAPGGLPTVGAFWLANILSTLLFGAGHLPATKTVTRLTPTIVARALLLNGIPGVILGYIYMRYGLEAAIITHFSLDILIHLIAVPFQARRARSLTPDAAVQPASD